MGCILGCIRLKSTSQSEQEGKKSKRDNNLDDLDRSRCQLKCPENVQYTKENNRSDKNDSRKNIEDQKKYKPKIQRILKKEHDIKLEDLHLSFQGFHKQSLSSKPDKTKQKLPKNQEAQQNLEQIKKQKIVVPKLNPSEKQGIKLKNQRKYQSTPCQKKEQNYPQNMKQSAIIHRVSFSSQNNNLNKNSSDVNNCSTPNIRQSTAKQVISNKSWGNIPVQKQHQSKSDCIQGPKISIVVQRRIPISQLERRNTFISNNFSQNIGSLSRYQPQTTKKQSDALHTPKYPGKNSIKNTPIQIKYQSTPQDDSSIRESLPLMTIKKTYKQSSNKQPQLSDDLIIINQSHLVSKIKHPPIPKYNQTRINIHTNMQPEQKYESMGRKQDIGSVQGLQNQEKIINTSQIISREKPMNAQKCEKNTGEGIKQNITIPLTRSMKFTDSRVIS